MDRVSPKVRSRNMARIRSIDTQLEKRVRSFLHDQGLRYRLHDRNLPGQPDLVFRSRGVCVFVHGCFWHGCPKCSDGTRKVKSNRSYWLSKIERNKIRDSVTLKTLRRIGWNAYIIWGCEVKSPRHLERLLHRIQSVSPREGSQKPNR